MFTSVCNTLIDNFISKYQQDDVIVQPVSVNDYIVHFNIYSNGQKQLHSLINIISEDINVIDFELFVIEEC